MAKCEICGEELKLDLYTRTYFCQNCKGKVEQNNSGIDFLVIYNELNDLNRKTYEADFAEKLINALGSEYKLEMNNQNVNAKMVIIFASRTSYLYSFRKYWSNFKNKSIILILRDIRREDLPLELRDSCIIDIDNASYIEDVRAEYRLLTEAIKEHISDISEAVDNSFNNNSLNEKINDDIIKNKLNMGVKDNPILTAVKTECEEVHNHEKKEENNDGDYEYKIYDLISEKKFNEANKLINEMICILPDNPELYLFRLMASIEVKDYEELALYPNKALNKYEDFNKALTLGDEEYKSFLLSLLDRQAIELKYQKAKNLILDDNTMIVEIKYAISILDEIIPYKDAGKLYEQYEIELERRMGTNLYNPNENLQEYIERRKNASKLIVKIFFTIFGIFFLIFILFMAIIFSAIFR